MSVDRDWLSRVRRANQEKVGLAGIGDAADSVLRRFQPSAAPPSAAAARVAPPDTPGASAAPPGSTDELVGRALRVAGWIVGGSVVVLGVSAVVAAVRGRRAANPRRRGRR